MSTQTTNYNLVKPSGTDAFNISTWNNNNDIIDEALQTHTNSIGENSNKIGVLSTNGITESDLATAIKNDRTQLSENTQNIATINTKIADTGWIPLTLLNGVTVSSSYTPQYRKIGETIYIRGLIANVATAEVIIATLPIGFRPSQSHYFVNTKNAYQPITFCITTNGNITLSGATNATYSTGYFNCINTSFSID